MNYQSYLIAGFATGLDKAVQPWMLPQEAQFELFDGYVYRAVWQKRQGYSQFATGQKGGTSYTESRMIHHVTNQLFATGNGTPGPYNGFAKSTFRQFLIAGNGTASPYNAFLANGHVTPGSVVIIDETGLQIIVDNGSGTFTGNGFGSINYTTGAVSVGFTNPVGIGNTISQTLSSTETPISRGSVVITHAASGQTVRDNGLGIFTGNGTGTINYQTGAISITFNANANATPITQSFDIFNGLPVMGVMNFYTQTNSRQLIVADTKYVNRYNPNTNRLEDISPTPLFTGTNSDFFSWTNYPDPDDDQRLLFVNNVDPIHQYSGGAVTVYPLYTNSVQITNVASGVVGNGTTGPYTINTPANTGIVPGTLSIIDTVGAQTVTDNLFGILQGAGTGTVDYLSGAIVVTFTVAVGVGNPINLTYKQLNTPLETCLHIRNMKDRGIALSTVEAGGIRRGLRIRISGTGAFGDVWTTDAIGAGFIDIPDNTYIQACDFNRDDLLIFTESSTWVMKYTNSDVVPFSLDRIDESRGSQAPYGTITYLNRTSAASTRGLILSDGYSVVRNDDKLPDFSFNQVNQARFFQCFAGAVDTDRDHYLIYPTPGHEVSDQILVTNYEEDNFALYRIPLSCMGSFIGAFDVTWDDLLIYSNWDQMAAVYGSWNSFGFTQGSPFAVGGGHEGQIFKLNVIEIEDYPVQIRGMTVIDALTLRITTDFQNYQIGDVITIEAAAGMIQANDKQGAIKNIVTPNYTFDIEINTANFSAYTSAGTASKVIQFSTKTKKFNPFAEQNLKVRCGWVYFYVSTTGTNLTDNKYIIGATNTNPCVLNIPGHGYVTGDQVFVDGVGGMTQLNGNYYYITVIDANFISLDGVDATAYGVYTSGGFATTPSPAKLTVRVIVNDTEQSTQVGSFNPAPYEINLTSQQASNGIKKWYKLFINQVGRFVQFEFGNQQSGAKVEIQAIMPGMAGVGRMI